MWQVRYPPCAMNAVMRKKNSAVPKLILFWAAWHTILSIKKGVRDCNSELRFFKQLTKFIELLYKISLYR